jgi:hypothetical protein
LQLQFGFSQVDLPVMGYGFAVKDDIATYRAQGRGVQPFALRDHKRTFSPRRLATI